MNFSAGHTVRSILAAVSCIFTFAFTLTLGDPGVGRAGELDHGLFRAIRRADAKLLQSLLRQGTPVNLQSADGTTPLMLAALHGDAECVRLLLDYGSDPNAANRKGVTPLLWAVGDAEKVRLLLDGGANVNARSSLGNTPLLSAAAYPGRADVVKTLLARGAELTARNRADRSALAMAVWGGDAEIVQLLFTTARESTKLQKLVADDAASLLETAAGQGNAEIIDLLLAHALPKERGDGSLPGRALNKALLAQKPEIARKLIEHGADLTRRTPEGNVPPIMLAAYTEFDDPSMAQLMIDLGVDVRAKNQYDESVLTWARRRGHPQLIELLATAGAPNVPDTTPEIPRRSVNLHAGNHRRLLRGTVQKSIALLERSSDVFLQTRGSCVSCHHQNLPSVALGWARDRGFEIDEASVRRMVDRQARTWRNRIDRTYQMDRPVPVPPRFLGYGLWGFGEWGYPADEITDSAVWYLANIQQPDGHWVPGMLRPPMGGGEITSTVLAMRSLQLYPLRFGPRQRFDRHVSRAAEWLSKRAPRSHQEQVYKLLGLRWAGWSRNKLSEQADMLLAAQRDDGGWAQLPHLESDAWATAQSLVALHVGAGLPVDHPAYQHGVQFLTSTQFDDGSWFVQSRTWPFQPSFDSQFPHGRDQWISAPATAWAVMALVLAVEPPSRVVVPRLEDPPRTEWRKDDNDETRDQTNASGSKAENENVSVSLVNDIKPLLERSCAGCHHGAEPKGGLRVTDRKSLLDGGESGDVAIVPGASGESPLLRFVSGEVPEMQMPPPEKRDKFPPLSKKELEALRVWIDQGADWPDGVKVEPPAY